MNDHGKLLIVLGDQLDPDHPGLRDYDAGRDRVWMAEVPEESTHVWSHKARIVLFLSAMRHFRDALAARGLTVIYRALDAHPHASLGSALDADLAALAPARVAVAQPGDYRVLRTLRETCARHGIALEVLEDTHFLVPAAAFADWAAGRRHFVMEHFYRWVRQREAILMHGREPAGGRWNFDADNRKAFGREGPGFTPPPRQSAPDAVTREVMALVERRFATHPGALADFDWPVTEADAEAALDDFIEHRLASFGPFQDAMWSGEPWLYHSRISAALNLKLINPRAAIDAAAQAWHQSQAPLASVEGFIRQIAGWREYVRGLCWLGMPEYLERNALGAQAPLPRFYWTGETHYRCLREVIGQTLRYGYAHHIQRLMVTGLFALLLGVEPRAVHAWYLAVYVDAVEWVELPNTLGMSQFADGGWLASKPYVASGKYIQRMSNYCAGCPLDPAKATGARACPFTTLYWDFLERHAARFARHPRVGQQWRNLERFSATERLAIRQAAEALRASLA